MKHQITEAEWNINPQFQEQDIKVGDRIDEKDLLFLPIPNDPIIGSKAERVIAQANPSHFENNRINVVKDKSEREVVRTYSGETDGQNWKKYAELYAKANGYELAPYRSTLAEKAGIEADSEAQAEEQRIDQEAEAERAKARPPKTLRSRVRSAAKKVVSKVRGR